MLKILELYSGIGGMQAAAHESGLMFQVAASYEINPVAIQVYAANFPKTDKPRNILGLGIEDLNRLQADVVMMSPPCQPFTRQGLKRDVEDARTSSFLHLLRLLQQVPQPPKMILLENVAGYETSQTRDLLIGMLNDRGYKWQEFLLSPTQFGIPNSRLRYYLLAKRSKTEPFSFAPSQEVLTEFPFCLCGGEEETTGANSGATESNSKTTESNTQTTESNSKRTDQIQTTECNIMTTESNSKTTDEIQTTKSTTESNIMTTESNSKTTDQIQTTKSTTTESNSKTGTNSNTCNHCSKLVKPSLTRLMRKHHPNRTSLSSPPPLISYLDPTINLDHFSLPDKVLRKYHTLLDIVTGESTRSCCFTKGYARYVEGTGSVVQHNARTSLSEIYGKVQDVNADDALKVELLRRLELRYFSPSEVLRLMCFPSWFSFPPTVTNKQRYRLLGNSINVLVVASLLLVLVEN